jgi:hypothetical protein
MVNVTLFGDNIQWMMNADRFKALFERRFRDFLSPD